MKKNTIISLSGVFLIILLIQGCGPSQAEYDSIKEENKELQSNLADLKQELDECKHGAEKLHSKMKRAFENENFSSCISIFSEMENRHPDSELFSEVKSIYDKVIAIEKKRKEEARLKAEREKQEKLKALNKLRKNHDDVSGNTWYKNPYFTHYNNRFLTSIYLGQNESSEWLRLKMSYKGDDWIFFEKAYLSYDGNTKEIPFDEYDNKETDHDGGEVWEWIDVSISSNIEDFLREFAKSKNAKMGLTGKYTKTRTLTYNERQGILDVLKGYDALKQGLN